MKTIQFPNDDSVTYPGAAGWALARIDNDTIVEVHEVLSDDAPAGLSLDAEAEWHLNAAADFAQAPGPGQVFYGFACGTDNAEIDYEFCDPQLFTLDLLPTIGRAIGEALGEME